MTVLSVSRINPQSLSAFQVSTANASIAYALQNAMMAAGSSAQLQTVSGLKVPNLLQVTITQPSMRDQFAWPGDWILVTDAAYDEETNAWTVASTTQVIAYGIGTGQVGTATDFIGTFTANTGLIWAATTAAPTAVAQPGLKAQIVTQQPASANGPFAYVVNLTDETANATTQVTPTVSIDAASQATLEIDLPSSGHAYHATVTVSATKYSDMTATSAQIETFTALDQTPE